MTSCFNYKKIDGIALLSLPVKREIMVVPDY